MHILYKYTWWRKKHIIRFF